MPSSNTYEVPILPCDFAQKDSVKDVTSTARDATHLARLAKDGLPFPVEKRVRKGFAIPVLLRAPCLA